MRVLSKTGGDLVILALSGEEVRRGDYLLLEDGVLRKKLILQVYDESYVDAPGLLDDILRDEVVNASVEGVNYDPLQTASISDLVKNARLLRCKIRAGFDDVGISSDVFWLPARTRSAVRRLSISELSSLLKGKGMRPIRIGATWSKEPFEIDAESLDGRLSIITGKKESGKSHLAKILASNLAELGAHVFIFDLNDEYSGLSMSRDGSPSRIASKVKVLHPGVELRFSLPYVGKRTMVSILQHSLDLPGTSLREFLRVWDAVDQGSLSLGALKSVLDGWRGNELVKDALLSRIYSLMSTRLFCDASQNGVRFEELVSSLPEGGVFVISLARVPSLVRRMVVELILGKLVELLEQNVVPPVFLFAEEAHLYLRETYWDDVVTRMRHFGIFTVFITNQPDAIQEGIYRQADNIFLFNFTSDTDLDTVAKASTADSDTVRSIVKFLPQRMCLVLGKASKELPVIVQVSEADIMTLGETKRIFQPIHSGARSAVPLVT